MASGDSAIEIIELSPDPHHNVSDKDITENEPMEEDVFLPITPQPKFSRIPAHAHSTPRPPGSLTDSDAYLTTNVFPDRRYHSEGVNSQTQSKPMASVGRKLYLFCLALIALSILIGFIVGYFIREKVFEREVASSPNEQGTFSADKMETFHRQALGNVSDDGIAYYESMFSQHKCSSVTPCSQRMSASVARKLRRMGFSNVDVSSYDVLTSQPDMSQISSLRILDTDGQQLHLEVLYGSKQETKQDKGEIQKDDTVNAEDEKTKRSVTEQEDGSTQTATLMYMPFSASGNVQGELVYTHYATQEDFLTLSKNKINMTGKIAIARQGTMMVTDQVRNVEEQGMRGLILYTDPSDMATIMSTSTERLVGMSGMMGDSLTPGCPAMDGISRMTMKAAGLPSIPVQPISPQLAESLLGNMTGRMAPNGWQGGLNATYYMGRKNTKKSTWTIELDVSNTMKKQSVHDVVTTIVGTHMPEGELVYTHYATQEDFLTLSKNKINMTGKIAIARQGTMMVTDQVRNVEEQGMRGLILYTDPSDMATIMSTSTERLVGMSGMMGDSLTPGCPAMDGISRMTMKAAGLPSIPVQPISPQLAESLLGNMTGRMAPNGWQGGLNATYYMGRKNTKKSTWTIELDVSNTMKKQSVHDVVTTIVGTHMPDEYIILGGHFPSMMPGMTVSGMTLMTPSGHGSLSMMMETATSLSSMLADGWRPQRTIKLGMWGGGDNGHAGSMEWVEEHRDVLNKRAVSYIDLDSMMGDNGTIKAQTSPLLTSVIMKAATMLELSDVIQPGMLNGICGHVAFSHMLGIPSARLHATPSEMLQMSNLSASQSMYMSVTKLATQTILLLADSDVIPFDTVAMGDMLMGFVGSLESKMGDVLVISNMTIDNLKVAVSDFMDVSRNMQSMMSDESMMESSVTMTMVNHRLMYMERALVGMDPSGTMTHILYGMTEKDTFSLVADYSPSNMNNETMTTLMQKVSFIQCSIQSATLSLKMDGS